MFSNTSKNISPTTLPSPTRVVNYVPDLANVACLSVFHFTRAFAATMGVPPHRYVSQRRLESAKAMIATGRVSLSEIALHCRFSSQSSLTRAFRRATGMTPGEYRRTSR